ncbi:reverse transcriptase-like protein [Lapidilactobacillus luobeiensis]|uniref:reverse transcriptase-like protein n=1 Tax=Lapidilactobacillus luobeiensis TaxID=2950371 RepID=UPI0021C3BE35|nr:reverse transcriptase-like protein [Lapidilactobacillus luobeiensis]
MIWLTTDSAVDNERCLTGIGFFIQGQQLARSPIRYGQKIAFTDNHHGEFQAVLAGLTYLAGQTTLAAQTVVLQTDSQLVEQALTKRYAKHYQSEVRAILALSDQCQLFLVKRITDRQNRTAHQLARQAIYG